MCLGKELAGISSALSMQENCAIQPQSNKKNDYCNRKQVSWQKNRRYLCKRSKDRKCSPCNKNIRKFFAWIANIDRLKALFSSFLNALKL